MSVAPDFEWPRPPVGGYTADDLDLLPNLPPHTELIDGGLVFVSPRTYFHMSTVSALEWGVRSTVPEGWQIWREMTIVLDRRNRPEPDILVVGVDAFAGPKQTAVQADDVLLAVEVASEESEARDRETKPRKYAAAGIRYFWRVESDEGRPVVYTYELDPATNGYVPTGIFHDRLKLDHPFLIDIALPGS